MNLSVVKLFGLVISVGSIIWGCGGTETKPTDAKPVGGSAKTLESLVPRSNDIAGWTVDPSFGKTAPYVAAMGKTALEAETLINGSASAFYTPPFTAVLAWQNYIKKSEYTVDLHIWEMPTAALASEMYSVLLTKYSLYSNNDWTPLTGVGNEGRICNTGTTWWINLYKANYVVEINLNKLPDGSEVLDTVGQTEAKAFATEFVKRI